MMTPSTLIIPTYNEEKYIGSVLTHFLSEPAAIVGEILVADGRSSDATRAIVSQFAARDARVKLIDNPERLQASGVNIAVAASESTHDNFIRVDAHSHYPSGYAASVRQAMIESGADSVVVRLRSEGKSCVQQAIATVSNSPIGTGGSAHRVGGVSAFVDHGHHAGFKRNIFEAVGGYDPSFEANEDAELDYRIRKLGGRIWLAGDIEIGYVPRATLRRLAIQYWRYGKGRARNYLKHRERLRVRQVIPPIMVLCVILGCVVLSVSPFGIVPLAAYIVGVLIGMAWLMFKTCKVCTLLAAPVLVTMHFSWGAGFLYQLLFKRGQMRLKAPQTITPSKAGAAE